MKKKSNKDFGAERTCTEDHSTWAICKLTNAGGKKIDKAISVRHALPVPALHLQAFAKHRDEFKLSFRCLSRETIQW